MKLLRKANNYVKTIAKSFCISSSLDISAIIILLDLDCFNKQFFKINLFSLFIEKQVLVWLETERPTYSH